MEIEGGLLLVGLCPVSAITQEPADEKPIAFLESLKEALQKITNLDFLSQCASDIRINLQQLQQQDPAASLDEMVQTVTNTFNNRTGDRGQGSGKGEKERDKACPDAGLPPEKSYGKPQVLEGQGTRQMPNL